MNIRGNTAMTSALSVKLTQEERDQIERYAAKHSMTISEAIRDILERHVKENTK